MEVRFISPESLLARLLIKNDQSRLILLTGLGGAGKTCRCLKLVEKARKEHLSLGGLISPPVYFNGNKVGIDLLDVASGGCRHLAYKRNYYSQGDAAGKPPFITKAELSTGAWLFDPDALAWGDDILKQTDECDLFILDEIGPLEFDRGLGFQAGFRHIDGRCHRLSVVVVRPALIPQAIERWPWAKIIPHTSSWKANKS